MNTEPLFGTDFAVHWISVEQTDRAEQGTGETGEKALRHSTMLLFSRTLPQANKMRLEEPLLVSSLVSIIVHLNRLKVFLRADLTFTPVLSNGQGLGSFKINSL